MKRLYLVLLLCMAPLCGAAAEDKDRPPRLVSVTGEAEVKAAPDKADVMITVYSEARTVAEAKRENDKKLRAFHDLLREMEIDKRDIEAAGSNISPRYNWSNNRQELDAYTVSHQAKITLRDPEKVGLLLEKLIGINIDRIDGVVYGLRDKSAVEEKAMLLAVEDARRKAEKVAAALGEKLGGAQQVAVGGGGYYPPPMPMMAKAAGGMEMSVDASAPPAPPPAGDITVRYTASASFLLE